MTPKQLAVVAAALVVGLLGRLVLRVSPRVGVRLVRWAAGLRYRQNPERAALRAEELTALVDDRPGRLLKLLTGLGFALHALTVAGLRAGFGRWRRLGAGFSRRAGPLAAFSLTYIPMMSAWTAVQWWVPRVVPVAKATAWWTGVAALTANPNISISLDLTGPLTGVGLGVGLVVEIAVGLGACALLRQVAPTAHRTKDWARASVAFLPALQVGAVAEATGEAIARTVGGLVAVLVTAAKVRAWYRRPAVSDVEVSDLEDR
jgi:hypothetical protein